MPLDPTVYADDPMATLTEALEQETAPAVAARWANMTPEDVEELEALVKRTGWSWFTVHDRLCSSVGEMQAIRAGKRLFPWNYWKPFLEAVAEAVEAIPIPDRPPLPEMTSPAVFAVPNIAVSVAAGLIATLFIEAEAFAPGDKENAQDAYGRVSEALGVETLVVKEIKKQRAERLKELVTGVPRQPGVLREAL